MDEKKKAIGDESGYAIIHEEYVGRETEKRCFRRHEITVAQWKKMTSPEELRFWKARGIIRNYTNWGYMVVGHSRRSWGYDIKVLDRFHIVKAGEEYTEIHKKMEEVAA